ncbi:MAG: hypothetical protein ACR2NZ_24440 [Rubripirellula sp.]
MSLQNAPSHSTSAYPVRSTSAPELERVGFVERRGSDGDVTTQAERRQFGSSHAELSDDGRELALAIDRYKIENHRRYLTCDELLVVIAELGFTKDAT